MNLGTMWRAMCASHHSTSRYASARPHVARPLGSHRPSRHSVGEVHSGCHLHRLMAHRLNPRVRTAPRLESLNRNCCLELIATVPVDRIGITIRTLPDILPVNFALVGEKIVFRIIPGMKLDAAAAGAVVEFEVDSYSPDGTSGWSVLVRGPCSEITDPAELAAMEAVRLRAWAFNEGIAQRLVCIEPSFVTGCRGVVSCTEDPDEKDASRGRDCQAVLNAVASVLNDSKEPGTRGPAGSGEDRLAPSIVNA